MKAPKLCAWNKLLLATLSVGAHAAENGAHAPQIQAFVAASVIGTTNHNFFGDTENGADTRFSEVGVNANWQALENVRISGQTLHRRAGESDEDGARIDYAQIDWTFLRNDDARLGLKFGKPKLPYGLYNETRDVPFTRPGILLPQSIYYDSIRNFLLAAPGAYLHGATLGEYGAIEVSAGLIRPDFSSESFYRNFPGLPDDSLEGRNSTAFSVRWDAPTDTTVALFRTELNSRFKPLADATLTLRSWMISLQQRIDTVTLTAEVVEPELERRGFNPFIDGNQQGRSWYVQGEWRFRPDWEAMLRFDQQYRNLDRRDNDTERARDLTVGLRWDATPSLMLRAEYHHIDGTGWRPAADNPGAPPEAQWNMWLLQAAWRF